MKKILTYLFLVATAILSAGDLTLENARILALQNNLELKAQRQNASSSTLDYYKSFAAYLPQGSASAGMSMPRDGVDSETRSIDISQPIVNTKALLGILNSKQSKKISDYSLQSSILSTLYQVDLRYYAVLKNTDLLKIAMDNSKYARNQLEIAQTKFQLGVISQTDVINLQATMAQREVEQIQAATSLDISREALAHFLQIDSSFSLPDIDPETLEAQTESFRTITSEDADKIITTLTTYAQKHNPQCKIAETNTKIKNNNYLGSYGSFIPTVNLRYGTNWQKTELQDNFSDSSTLSISASVPIFPLADSAVDIASHRHSLRAAQYSEKSTDSDIDLQIRQSVMNLIAAARATQSAKLSLVYSASLYQQKVVTFENNAISTTELLDASILLANANQLYTASLYSFLTSRAALLQQLGTTDEMVITNSLK